MKTIVFLILINAPMAIAAQNETEIIILHTNDSHGRILPVNVTTDDATSQMADPGESMMKLDRKGEIGGFAALATAVKQIRQQTGPENVLLVDGGDSFSDDMLAKLTKGEANITLMNMLGYEFMALGNHDFDFGPERTKELQKIAKFPMRGANVIDSATNRSFIGDPWIILKKNHLNIGLLALGYRNTHMTTSKKNVKGIKFSDSREYIKKYLAELDGKTDVIIVVSHEGLEHDKKLAEENPQIGIIVGGHSHDVTSKAEIVNKTWIVQAFSHNMAIGITTLKFSGKSLQNVDTRIQWLWHDSIKPDAEFSQAVDNLLQPHNDSMNAVVGKASTPIPRNYKSGSPFDFLTGEILIKETGSEAALLPGVGYGITINQGEIRRKDIISLLPHDSKIATLELTGEQIRKILEKSAENQEPDDPARKVGGLIQTAGISWTADLTKPVGSRVSDIKITGKTAEPRRYYRIVTHTGMLEGLHGYDELARGRNIKKTDQEISETIEKYISSSGSISAPEATIKLIKKSR